MFQNLSKNLQQKVNFVLFFLFPSIYKGREKGGERMGELFL